MIWSEITCDEMLDYDEMLDIFSAGSNNNPPNNNTPNKNTNHNNNIYIFLYICIGNIRRPGVC
jgi:hypothetical protein